MDDYAEASEDSLLIVSRRRGRPQAQEPSTPVTTWVPTRLHDRLCQLAAAHDVSVSSLVKNMLTVQLHRK